MLKLLVPVAALTGAAEGLQIPSWTYMVITLLGAGGLFRFFMLRTEKRLSDAGASKTEAEANEIEDRVRRALSEEVEASMARQREETARAQAAEKEAIAEVALLVAQHTRDRAEWKEERHVFINDLRDRDNQITLMRAEIKSLRDEVHTLRVALGVEQDRRVDDLRMTRIEERAEVAKERADVAQDRADAAAQTADEQQHRNDDTPGHA